MQREADRERATSPDDPDRATRSLRVVSLLVLLLAAQSLVASCGGGSGDRGDSESSNMPLRDPSEYYGTMRAVGGEVGAVLGPKAFVMVEEADRASGRYPEGLLVVNDSERTPAPKLAVGQPVTAFGRLEELQSGEAGGETGLNPDDEALRRYVHKPWLEASTVDAAEPERQGGTTR